MAVFSRPQRTRCLIMFLFSAFFFAINIISYLVSINVIQSTGSMPTLQYFNGIGQFLKIFSAEGIAELSQLFKTDWLNGLVWFTPILLLLFSFIAIIRDIFHLLFGKFAKIEHIILPALICATSVLLCFFPLFVALKNGDTSFNNVSYLQELSKNDPLSFSVGIISIVYLFLGVFLAILPRYQSSRD